MGSLAKARRKPSSSVHFKGGLQPVVQIKTSSHQGSDHSEQLCQSGQKPFPQRGTDLSPRKVGSRASPGPVFSSLLQLAVFSTQTGKQVEAYFRSESVEQVPQNRHIQDGNSGHHPDLSTKRGVGNLAGFQRRILSHPHSPPVKEVHEILPQQTSVPVLCPSLRVGHGSSRVHQGGQGGETYGSEQGYKNPPVPRRLVTESPFEGNWSTSHPSSVVSLPQTGLAGQHQKVGVESSTGLYLRRLPVRPVDGSGFANSRKMGKLASVAVVFKGSGQLHGQAVHVLDRTLDRHRETGLVRSSPHASHSVALTLAGTRGLRESHSSTSLSSASPRLVVRRGKCVKRSALTSIKSRPSTVYRRIKRRLRRSLRDSTARGVWSEVESQLHINFLELKAVFLALRSFELLCQNQIVLVATDNTTVVAYINKQEGMKSGSLCALLWRLLSWCHPRGIVLRARHILGRLNMIADKLSRHNQVIQTEWSLDQSVFNLLCLRWAQPQVDLFATRYNYKLPKFVSPVPDPTAWAVDALSLPWQDLDAYAFPPVALLSQVISKIPKVGHFCQMV